MYILDDSFFDRQTGLCLFQCVYVNVYIRKNLVIDFLQHYITLPILCICFMHIPRPTRDGKISQMSGFEFNFFFSFEEQFLRGMERREPSLQAACQMLENDELFIWFFVSYVLCKRRNSLERRCIGTLLICRLRHGIMF